jgi:hypothetical protein
LSLGETVAGDNGCALGEAEFDPLIVQVDEGEVGVGGEISANCGGLQFTATGLIGVDPISGTYGHVGRSLTPVIDTVRLNGDISIQMS